MKVIVESPESEREELDLQSSEEDECDDDEEENNALLHDILRYRMLYAQAQLASRPSERRLRAMWSLLRNIGETLRLLAPAALIAIICGRDSPVIKFFQQFDRALRNALFPPPSQVEYILKWLQECLPGDERLASLDAVWTDGTILCDLLNSIIPGTCAGHEKDASVDLSHGQRLIEQYLGVTPIFSEEDLSQKTLSTYQECRLSHYLCKIREAITQMTPPVSRAGSPILNVQAYTFDYVARGMGIVTAYKGRKASFYIYPTAQQSLEPGDISVQIRGPGTCYGSAIVPVIYGRTHIIRNVILNLGKKQSFSHLPSPFTQGASYMRDYNTDVESKYFIPKIRNEIDVKVIVKNDRVKVSYTPTLVGNHEISLTSKGCHLIGSPYEIHVEIALAHKQESTDYSDEDPSETITKSDRKVVFSVVDFVTEKMILTEDGRLEKISNEDADILLKSKISELELTDKYTQISQKLNRVQSPDIITENDKTVTKFVHALMKFRTAVQKIITMLNVCREFKKCTMRLTFSRNPYSQMRATPDVVNSTISDNSRYNETKDEDKRENADIFRQKFRSGHSSFNTTAEDNQQSEDICENDCICNAESVTKHDHGISGISQDETEQSSSDIESLNNRSEEVYKVLKTGASIDIIISSFDDDDDILVPRSLPPIDVLPALEEVPERPKTPVFKVLQSDPDEDADISTVEKEKRKVEIDGDFSLDYYVNFDENSPESDSVQKLSVDRDDDDNGRLSPSINFHIGEPVTPTRMLNQTSIEPDMDSIILASNLEEALEKYDLKIRKTIHYLGTSEESDSSEFTTPMRQTPFEQMTDGEILKMYEEVVPNNEINNKLSDQNESYNGFGSIHDFNIQKGGVNIMRKPHDARNLVLVQQDSLSSEDRESNFSGFNVSVDTWDSAYVSIDEVNSSPDTNSSSRSDYSPRPKLYSIQEAIRENSPTPTWDILDVEPEQTQIWRARVEGEMQREKEFNEACSTTGETNIFPKSLRIFSHKISIIDEDDGTPHSSCYDTSNKNRVYNAESQNNSYKKYDFSASDNIADVKQSTNYRNISTIQTVSSELNRENLTLHSRHQLENTQEININKKVYNNENYEDLDYEATQWTKMVSKKKEYWDNKIKALQSREEKRVNTISRKRTPHIKRNDSLSKKKGKQAIVKSQNMTEIWKNSFETHNNGANLSSQSLVARWKEYWNERIDQGVQKRCNLSDIKQGKLKNICDLYNSDESTSTPEDSMRNDKNSTSHFLGLSRERAEPFYASINNELPFGGNKNIMESKYQPTPINLNSVTERIDKFLESLPAPTPDQNESEEVRVNTPNTVFGGIVSKNVNIFDNNNNNREDYGKAVKQEQEIDKIKIISNDCQSAKRIETLQQINTYTAPDFFESNLKSSVERWETKDTFINKEPIQTQKSVEDIYHEENLTFPCISDIKAKIENVNASEARTNFTKHKSKTFDASKPNKADILKKSKSLTRMDEEMNFITLEQQELNKTSSIVELRKVFTKSFSTDHIDLNISTESIPSIKNRKLRLEKHLQMVQLNISIREKEKNTQNINSKQKSIIENNIVVEPMEIIKSDNDIVTENNCMEEVPVFKPIGDIVKVFERKTSPEVHTKGNKEALASVTGKECQGLAAAIKEKSGRCFASVAEKGEGTKERLKKDTSLLPANSDHTDTKTDNEDKYLFTGMYASLTDLVSQCKNDDRVTQESDLTPVTDLEEVKADYEYKDRFKQAKNFFQQLDKSIVKEKPKAPQKKVNECERILLGLETKENDFKTIDDDNKQTSDDSTEEKPVKPTKPVRKFPRRSMTTPVSDTEYELHKRALLKIENDRPRLRKISEKFMVEGLFKDVVGDMHMHGYGFKGIPHKNAVLATFKSMESVHQPSSYEITTSQLEDFAKKNGIVNAQMYHTDFPYLPTTEPSKYRARYDAVASGLIKRKDLLKTQNKHVRRFSEPSRPRMRLEYVEEI